MPTHNRKEFQYAWCCSRSLSQGSRQHTPLSALVAEVGRCPRIPGATSTVSDTAAKRDQPAKVRMLTGTQPDRFDGLTISYKDWWANIRPSNTEPLLRLNIEAVGGQLLEEKRPELLSIIRK
ncbi:MAG: hypothetical protein QME74_02975 [Candidatus Edwardsbacteria bacterium]|nr:hypothetical protein [Candidatus Edwardsbacteria bacterium]